MRRGDGLVALDLAQGETGLAWEYVPPTVFLAAPSQARPLYLDRQETGREPPIGVIDAEQRRRREFPRQHSHAYPTWRLRDELVAELAHRHGVQPDCVLLGNGVMELLAAAFAHLRTRVANAVVPAPSFWPAYGYAVHHGYRWLLMPPYREDHDGGRFVLPEGALERALDAGPSLCYLSVPDNPVGAVLGAERFLDCVRRWPDSAFFVDGSYMSYTEDPRWDRWRHPCAELIASGATNVLCGHTFSKEYALANHRVGYLLGPPQLLAALRRRGGPYGMAETGLAMALYNLRDDGYARRNVADIRAHKRVFTELLTRAGVPHLAGAHNSVIVRAPGWYERLMEHNVAVRKVEYHPAIPNPLHGSVRITIPAERGDLEILSRAAREVIQSLA